MRRVRDIVSGIPSTVDVSDKMDASLTLGIRKSFDKESTSVTTPSSPGRFFQRLTPRRRSFKKKSTAVSDVPLGIQRSPFMMRAEAYSNNHSPETSFSTGSEEGSQYRKVPKVSMVDSSESETVDEERYEAYRKKPQHRYPESDENCRSSRSISSASQRDMTVEKNGIGGFRSRHRSTDLPPRNVPVQKEHQAPHSPSSRSRYTEGSKYTDDSEIPPIPSVVRDVSIPRKINAPEIKRKSRDHVRIKESKPLFGRSRSSITSLQVTETVKDAVTDEPLVKIFLLLLQPKAKIFELIQLLYPPSVTTIGDIIDLIPANATELALGQQKYVGLTRPKRRSKEIMDLSLMASNDAEQESVGISQGEIFVAIPEGYTAKHVVSLSKQILANPRIRELLETSRPMPTGQKGLSDSECMVSVHSSRRMEVVHEEPDNVSDFEQGLRRAIQNAAETNSASLVRQEKRASYPNFTTNTDQIKNLTVRLPAVGGNYVEEDTSLQGSYSSWSKSFDSSVTSLHQKRKSGHSAAVTLPRSRRRSKQMATIAKGAAAVFVVMVLRYWMDGATTAISVTNPENPLGILGFLQLVLCFAALCRMQRIHKRNLHAQMM